MSDLRYAAVSAAIRSGLLPSFAVEMSTSEAFALLTKIVNNG